MVVATPTTKSAILVVSTLPAQLGGFPSHLISPRTGRTLNDRETITAATSISTVGNTIDTAATRGATASPGALEVSVCTHHPFPPHPLPQIITQTQTCTQT